MSTRPTHSTLKFRPSDEDLEAPFQKGTKGDWLLVVWGEDEKDGFKHIIEAAVCVDRGVLLRLCRQKKYPKLPRGAGLEVFAC